LQGDRESGADESPKHTIVATDEGTGTDTQTTEPGREIGEEMNTDPSAEEKISWNI
jgi:hypothetical protein